MTRTSIAPWICSFAAALYCAAAAQVPNPSERLKDFDARVGAYMKLRRASEGDGPTLRATASADEISKRQAQLAASIRQHRPAEQGSIFTPEIAAEFRRLMSVTMSGPDGAGIRKSLGSSEPVKLSLSVNDTYPAKAPLQSTPPTLLMNLPKLPPELEYRIIGRALVLMDAKAGIIVDFIPDLVK